MNKEILVTGYTDPDLDGFSCILAYSDFLNKTGRPAIAAVFGKPHPEANFVVNEYDLKIELPAQDPEEYERIVLVDSSDTDGIDKRIDPKRVIEIIDHRKVNMSESFPNAKAQIKFVGAAATLIAEKFIEQKIDLSKENATLIYGAILSNTLNFLAKVTTDRDKAIAKYLKEKFNFPDDFAHKMFLAKSDFAGKKLSESIWGDFANFKSHNFSGKKVGVSQLEMIDGQKLAETRASEIVSEIDAIMKKLDLDTVFLTIIDLEANQNILVAPNKKIEDLLSKVLEIKFENHMAIRPGLIMRKEILPKIKEELCR